ncbi:D-alanyl-D-alanine carboxypeptidase [Consotaella salsifontis]|uniref:D-alanyl-D-alanine carboxypeptidase n=1 Tax=Consotaella salsifontis TaxID=1365950 RepID=A0A1T4SZ95_9HYPH|nr:D-alanyl-D-alanine carboxypeptidase [Consotaella salsifontis]SKA33515.1 D-alanyl-D-alanine carboxypeptidase [Consotaella salsifontis]
MAFPRLKLAISAFSKIVCTAALGTALLVGSPGVPTAFAKGRDIHSAFIIDVNTGKVLYSEDADEQRYPASLTKMMTLYLTFSAMRSGRINWQTEMPVSSYAAGRPPSKLGLKPGSTLSVEDAVYSLVTRSANDAAVVLGEYIGGSESAFAEMMTAKARQLGMRNTVFKNANGLPNSGQHTTARDMATLGIALRAHFPDYYKVFSTRSYTYRGQKIGNHNRVLGRIDGADGIKTGYINASGFNLVTSVLKDGKSVVGVVMGGPSTRSRDDEMVKLINKYLPQASSGGRGPLVASYTPSAGVAAVALPRTGPVPTTRFAAKSPEPRAEERQLTIEQRIAMAYEEEQVSRSAAPVPSERPLLSREALRRALITPARAQPRPQPMALPTAVGYAPAPKSSGLPVPPAAIPGGRDLDPRTTGSVASAAPASADAAPTSPWVVQIAAVPDRQGAMNMLAEAKRQVGGALAHAEPFAESTVSRSQVVYRARFAGFQTKDQAWDACSALKKHSYACYAVAN